MKHLIASATLVLLVAGQALAEVDPNVHQACIKATDYSGCVKAHTQPDDSVGIPALKKAMRISASRLEYVSVNGLGEAILPVREALSTIDKEDDFYVPNARKAIQMAEAWAEIRKLTIQADVGTPDGFRRALGADEHLISCSVANSLVKMANDSAGNMVVSLTWSKSNNVFAGLFGLRDSCRYRRNQIEGPLLSATIDTLTQNRPQTAPESQLPGATVSPIIMNTPWLKP